MSREVIAYNVANVKCGQYDQQKSERKGKGKGGEMVPGVKSGGEVVGVYP